MEYGNKIIFYNNIVWNQSDEDDPYAETCRKGVARWTAQDSAFHSRFDHFYPISTEGTGWR